MNERLQKIIARAGIVSRRRAESLILEGAVTVNGRVVRELGTRADPARDHIKVNGKLIRPEPLEYYMINKPRGVLSSVSDPEGRRVITDLVPSSARLYPAGRLDYNSEGLIILTNDGELARSITRAGKLAKVYQIKVQGVPDDEKLERLRKGVRIDGVWMQLPGSCRWKKVTIPGRRSPQNNTSDQGRIMPLEKGNNSWWKEELLEGKNRQLRWMFERIGHPVLKLRRIAIGKLKLGKLPAGAYRELTEEEVRLLKGGKE